MALIKCRECGHMISDRATKCPKCGCPIVRRPVPPVQQPQPRPQRSQQPQAAQPQPAPQAERPQSKPQQPVVSPQPQKQGRGKTIAIVLLSVALVAVVVVLLILLLRGKDTPAETMRISSQNVTTMSTPSAPSASSSSTGTSQSSSSSASSPSGGYTSEISGSKRYDGDIEGIKCYFSLYFEAKDDGGAQDVSGSYYYKKSGSDHPLGLRGTYYEETGVLFLREYLEDGSPHASLEVTYDKYSGNFYGTFTRYTGERMSISMRGI